MNTQDNLLYLSALGKLAERYRLAMFANLDDNVTDILGGTMTINLSVKKSYSALLRTFSDVIVSEDRELLELFDRDTLRGHFAESDEPVKLSVRVYELESEPRWVEVSVERLNKLWFLILITDIDKVRRLERNLKDALASSERAGNVKRYFLGKMSHELRTPMNAIIGMANIAASQLGDPPAAKLSIDKVRDSAFKLLSIINQILDMSKLSYGRTVIDSKPMDLFPFSEDLALISTLQCRRSGKNISFEAKSLHSRFVKGDEVRIKRVFLNLLANAARFARESVKITMMQGSNVTDGTARLIITMSDDGVGMPKEFIPQAYDMFVQAPDARVPRKAGYIRGFKKPEYGVNKIEEKYKFSSGNNKELRALKFKYSSGIGLGLSICRSLLALMNGAIVINSIPNVGTDVRIEIPMELDFERERRGKPRVSDETAEVDSAILKDKKVLLAEDDSISAEIAEMILESSGLKVTHAANGYKAVELFRESKIYEYCAIVMDIQMPIMDGFTATDMIRTMHRPDGRRIPIIALTANVYADDIARAKIHNMTGHLAKPVNAQELISTLTAAVSAAQSEF